MNMMPVCGLCTAFAFQLLKNSYVHHQQQHSIEYIFYWNSRDADTKIFCIIIPYDRDRSKKSIYNKKGDEYNGIRNDKGCCIKMPEKFFIGKKEKDKGAGENKGPGSVQLFIKYNPEYYQYSSQYLQYYFIMRLIF